MWRYELGRRYLPTSRLSMGSLAVPDDPTGDPGWLVPHGRRPSHLLLPEDEDVVVPIASLRSRGTRS